jgi:hypothetical protein
MNLQAVSVGIVFLVGALVLFLLDATTPKDERVPVRPWISHSHESVRLSIVALSVAGLVLTAVGLIL